jgi:hypothetical protein
MRRALLTVLVLLGGSSVAWAQVQLVSAAGTQATSKVTADEVVARFMTFDGDSDGRIAIGELSERLRPLVARGDTNGDGALDRAEIRELAVTPAPAANRSFPPSGGYSFGDDVGLSSSAHIEGALEDLRLTSDTSDRALPIVRSYVALVEVNAKTELLNQLQPLLSPQQLQAVTTALNNRRITVRTSQGEAPQISRLAAGGDLARRVEAMRLGAPQDEQARKAIDEFKLRMRLGIEADRAELLTQLKDVLNVEELDNFRAALERRPVVASSPAFHVLLNDVVRNVANPPSGAAVFIGDVLPPPNVTGR